MHILRVLEPILPKLRHCCVGWPNVLLTIEFPRATLSYDSAGEGPSLVVIYRDVGSGLLDRSEKNCFVDGHSNFVDFKGTLTDLAMEDTQSVLITCTHRQQLTAYTDPTNDV